MKRMKTQIALTFVILVITCIVINGLFNLIVLEGNFITPVIVIISLYDAGFYLAFIFSETKQIPWSICIICMVVLKTFLLLPYLSAIRLNMLFVSDFQWFCLSLIEFVYFLVLYIVADSHSKKLLTLLNDKQSSKNAEN